MRVLVTLLVTGLILLPFPEGTSAQTAASGAGMQVKIGALRSEASAEVFFGVESGIFRKAGLSVELELFNNGAAISAAVVGGSLDIGLADMVTGVNAHARGISLVYLFPGSVSTEAAPEFNLVSRDDSFLRTARDYEGATIGVGGLNNIASLQTRAWIDNNGGSAKTVQFVEIPPAAHKDVVLQRKVKAAIETEPAATLDAAEGMRVIPLAKNGIAPEFQVNGWVTTSEWVGRNPNVALRFVAAMHETAVWANLNHGLTAPMLARYGGIPESVVAKMPRYLYGEDADPNLIRPVIDAAVRYGIIGKGFDAREMMYRKTPARS